MAARYPRILISFADGGLSDRLKWRLENSAGWVVDSGAFTAWKKGREYKVEDYLEYLAEMKRVRGYEGAFVLDVIGNPEKTEKRWFEMMEMGEKTIPIVTVGSDLEVVDRYVEAGADRIAIGGLVRNRHARENIIAFEKKVRGRAKTHWLGVTTHKVMRALRPWSVDSSGWSAGMRYGGIRVYMGCGRSGGWRWLTLEKKAKPSWEVRKRLEGWGLDWRRLGKAAEWWGRNGMMAQVIPSLSWIEYTEDVLRKWGTRVYLAVGGDGAHHLDAAVELRSGSRRYE